MDRNSLPRPRARPAVEATGELSEFEARQLAKLLDRAGVSEQEARQARAQEIAAELKKAAMAERLEKLEADLDVALVELKQLAPHAVAFREVSAKLAQVVKLIPKQSWFGGPADNFGADGLILLGEIALSAYEQAARPSGRQPSLRERMQSVGVNIGPDGPQPSSGREAIASEILRQGRLRRGEEK